MGYGILIGIILTIIYDRILSPIIDLIIEQYRYYISKKCTKFKIDSDSMAMEFQKQYPEFKEQNENSQQLSNMIGFHMDSDSEDLDYDDDFNEE